jgi:hypothetical protein
MLASCICNCRAISNTTRLAMRQALAQHYPAMIWEAEVGGKAYDMTIESLHRRLHRLWGHLYTSRRKALSRRALITSSHPE